MFRAVIVAALLSLFLSPGVVAQITGRESHAPDTLLLSFVGDIMHHDTNADMPNYNRLYDAVRGYLAEDDLSFANIEFPVDPAREPAGYPIFNGTPEYVEAAITAGFDVFSLANNHSYDLGTEGVRSTSAVFAAFAGEHGTRHNGLRAAPNAAIEPTVITPGGWTVGFVAVTGFSNVGGSAPHINLVDYANSRSVAAFLARVDEWDSQFDLLIVSVHGGTEYVQAPDEDKAQFFRDLVVHGADIVWGHHPHVMQPWEIVRIGSATRLIMHSTGNFVSGQRRLQRPDLPFGTWAPTGDTAVFRVQVWRGGGSSLSVTLESAPVFTVYNDPDDSYVLRTFGDVLTEPLTPDWRAFYMARYAATREFLSVPVRSFRYERAGTLSP